MRSFIERIWTKHPSTLHFVQWDLGNEVWELRPGSEMRHFGILERQVLADGSVKEVLEILPEAPVPLEALGFHEIQGQWMISEKTISRGEEGKTRKEHSQQSLRQVQPPLKEQGKKPPVKSASSEGQKTSHELPKSQDGESQVTESLQLSSTLPSELWSSLSQWIPSDVLFQPSLHQQASQELSDTQGLSSVSPKGPLPNSQSSRVPRPSGAKVQHSRPFRPKTSSRAR